MKRLDNFGFKKYRGHYRQFPERMGTTLLSVPEEEIEQQTRFNLDTLQFASAAIVHPIDLDDAGRPQLIESKANLP